MVIEVVLRIHAYFDRRNKRTLYSKVKKIE